MATPVVFPILPLNIEGQELTPADASSITSVTIQNSFDTITDFIEAYLYDINGNIITRLTTNYSVTSGIISGSTVTELNLDPASDLIKNNYTQGEYSVNYNFLSSFLQGNPLFKIQEISSTRTEIRVNNSGFNTKQLQATSEIISSFLNSTPTFQGYYLDFGLDNILLGVNIASDETSLLVKLYEPLPDLYDINSSFNFVKKKAEPVAYSITFPQEEVPITPGPYLKGPNFNIGSSQRTNTSTNYQTQESLFSSSIALTNQLKSVLVERRVELNTDYTDFSNFIFFSSAQQRLENFYYKASLIEDYTNQITILNTLSVTTEVSASKAVYQEKINSLILNFDGYDYFLYFDSGSKSWPKSNNTKPYTLYGTGSIEVLTWYTAQINSGSLYDEENQNYIYNVYPIYITEDSDNTEFRLFNEMVAQMFDQVWLYTKAIENRQDGDNRLSEGISIDLAADALRSYGVSLYESSFANVDLYTTYLGISPGGSTLPPTGSELITTYVTASADTTPFNDAQKLIYKRLYHNLPYLLKKKGTISGLRVLLNCFGIPDTLIRINEFGGKDKNTNTWDNWQYQFNYAYNATGSNQITSSFVLNPAWNATDDRPSSVAFRFKPELNYPTQASQSLWTLDSGQVKVVLEYTGSGISSGSYSGSITNPYNQYGTLKLVVNSNTSASIFLPFFDGDWWSVLVTSGSSAGYDIYAKSNTFGNTVKNIIGFQASASINTATSWSLSTTSSFGNTFSGSLQEIRYYKTRISQDVFNDYVMNPYSIEGNSINTGPEELVFRAALGGELYTGSTSIHPKNSGVWTTTASFTNTSNFYYSTSPTFSANYEYIYFDQVAAGIKNPVNNKISNVAINLPPVASTSYASNKVLSSYISVQQDTEQSRKYTPDVNYVEIALSPTSEINEDINAAFGYFNIGDYIGDPRQLSSSAYTYPELVTLGGNYFEKYSQTYNWTDFLRLLKYFDNAVFRMLKDFIPARAGVTTGAVIKQHLLERNRQRPAQLDYTQPEYTASVTSLARDYQTGSIEVFTGGAGGSVNVLTNISQSWSSSILTKAGLVTEIESSQYEFFNGEYSGSNIDVVNNKLQDNPLLGAAYRVSIPDLQNLTVKSATFLASASLFDGINYYSTGSVRFNNLINYIDYYNTGTYKYTPNYNTQADIVATITGSIISGSQETGELFVYLYENGEPVAFTSYYTTTSNQQEAFTLTLTVPDYYITSGSTYEIKYLISNNFPLPTTTASINSNSTWTVSVDNLAAQSTYYLDPTVYTQQNFPGDINDFSDYNTLLNNVYSNRVSNIYYDVDYSQNALNPVNFTTLISQSALYAQVQDSNYSSGSAWAKGRYNGTKLTSATYNTYTPGDISYGQTAVIDTYSTYFLYFSKITLAQAGVDGLYSGGNVKGVALIGPDGTSISLDKTNDNLGLIQSLFPSASIVTLISPLPPLGTDLGPNNLSVIIGGGVDTGIIVPGTYTPDETNILIRSSKGDAVVFVDSPGYLVPSGYSPEYLKKIVDTAAKAGFPIN